jgi:cell division protein FtsX
MTVIYHVARRFKQAFVWVKNNPAQTALLIAALCFSVFVIGMCAVFVTMMSHHHPH